LPVHVTPTVGDVNGVRRQYCTYAVSIYYATEKFKQFKNIRGGLSQFVRITKPVASLAIQ